MFKVTYSVLRDQQLAEDITQETFIKMMDALPSYQQKGFKTWLSRIAMNKAIDHKRKQSRKPEDLSDFSDKELKQDDGTSAEDLVISQERTERIRRSIDALPDNYKEVVEAFYINGRSYHEIAQQQQISVKTVEVKLYRARKWMKHNWKEEDF